MKKQIFEAFKENPELLKNNQILYKSFPSLKESTLRDYKSEFLKSNPSYRPNDTKKPEVKTSAPNYKTEQDKVKDKISEKQLQDNPNTCKTSERQKKDSIDILQWLIENKSRLEKLIETNQNISTISGFKKSGSTKMSAWRINQELTKQFTEKCKALGLAQTQAIHIAINNFLTKYN